MLICPSRKATLRVKEVTVPGLAESKEPRINYQLTTGAARLGIANGKIRYIWSAG